MPTWGMCSRTDRTQQVSGSVSTAWPSLLKPEETANLRKTDELHGLAEITENTVSRQARQHEGPESERSVPVF